MNKPKTRRWNMLFQPELFDKVQALAHRRGVSVSEIIRLALVSLIKAVEKADAAKKGSA
jgi:hypothetical protein